MYMCDVKFIRDARRRVIFVPTSLYQWIHKIPRLHRTITTVLFRTASIPVYLVHNFLHRKYLVVCIYEYMLPPMF